MTPRDRKTRSRRFKEQRGPERRDVYFPDGISPARTGLNVDRKYFPGAYKDTSDKQQHKMNYVPGTASLIDDIDKKHLVLLRDGRTLIGFLRSIDQFANLVFHQTVERIHVGKKFGDIPRGIFIVRGENVVLLGEIDMDKPCDTVLQQVSIEEILEEQRLQQQAKQETEKVKMQVLKDRGLSVPKADNLDEY
ncbi:unnamed protein product [Pleuronectes platessa]|uniref:U6 snRNA-associated Sm-like protein LSm1 n=2 Tax=Pleuronectidae TaxID=8256 RepID=A0A9N7YKC9_PLEPL|nr:unnamed protein product [Pleuronectes platessa]